MQLRMWLALSPARPVGAVSAWLDGVLGDDGALLLTDPGLLALTDDWVVTLPPESFDGVLPALRRSFARFEAAQRRTIGEGLRGLERERAEHALDDDLGMLPVPFVLRLLGVHP